MIRCARSVYITNPTQETCPRSCRLCGPHAVTWARSYRSGICLPYLGDLSRSWSVVVNRWSGRGVNHWYPYVRAWYSSKILAWCWIIGISNDCSSLKCLSLYWIIGISTNELKLKTIVLICVLRLSFFAFRIFVFSRLPVLCVSRRWWWGHAISRPSWPPPKTGVSSQGQTWLPIWKACLGRGWRTGRWRRLPMPCMLVRATTWPCRALIRWFTWTFFAPICPIPCTY